jgi:hypothetical protein
MNVAAGLYGFAMTDNLSSSESNPDFPTIFCPRCGSIRVTIFVHGFPSFDAFEHADQLKKAGNKENRYDFQGCEVADEDLHLRCRACRYSE